MLGVADVSKNPSKGALDSFSQEKEYRLYGDSINVRLLTHNSIWPPQSPSPPVMSRTSLEHPQDQSLEFPDPTAGKGVLECGK